MIAFIALGGILGTLARYLVGAWLQGPHVVFPRGTLAINIAGSFVLGLVMRLATGSTLVSPEVRGALTIGFCGAFTTMSTFSYETVGLLADGEYWRAGIYAGSTVFGCLAATAAGIALATRLL
jgi:fluoride exporter